MPAAEEVSREIVDSSSPTMPVIIDLRAQLSDRASRLSALIRFINLNGVLGKVCLFFSSSPLLLLSIIV